MLVKSKEEKTLSKGEVELSGFCSRLHQDVQEFQQKTGTQFINDQVMIRQASPFFGRVYGFYYKYNSAFPAATSGYKEENAKLKWQLQILNICLLISVRSGDENLLANCTLLLPMCADTIFPSVYSDFKKELETITTRVKPSEMLPGSLATLTDLEVTKSMLAKQQMANDLNEVILPEAQKLIEAKEEVRSVILAGLQKKVNRTLIEKYNRRILALKEEITNFRAETKQHDEKTAMLTYAIALVMEHLVQGKPISPDMSALYQKIAASITPLPSPTSNTPRDEPGMDFGVYSSDEELRMTAGQAKR